MLDFFRDLYLETHGIDSQKAEKERKAKQEEKRKTYHLFTGKTRVLLICMAVLFIVIQTFNFPRIVGRGIFFVLTSIFLCVIAIAAIVLLLINRKKTQIAAAVLVGIFAVLEYAFMVSLIYLE